MMKKLLSILLAIYGASALQAQNMLSLNEAVEIALKNNYDIQLAKTAADVTAINNNAGNAGMLPNIDFNVSENLSNTNINQKFSNGLEVQSNGVGATNLNANVALSWTLFDGMKMFATKHRLEELETQSGFALKEQIQQTVAQVMVEYYAIVGQKMQIKSTQKALDLVQKRLEIVKTQYQVGTVSAFELNQVTIDQNTNQTNLLLQQNNLKNQMAGFNVLLAREADIVFDVIETIDVDTAQAPTIDKDLENKNFALLSAERSISVAGFQLSEARAQRLPIVRLNSSYAYTRQTSQAGFSLLNQSNGLNAGVTASIPLFRGGTIKNQIKTTQLQLRSSQLQYSRLKNSVSYQYQQAFNNFTAYKTIVGMEENNAKLALGNLTIAEGRLKQGLSTLLEVKEADRNWQDAESRLIEARYNLKVAEIQLQQLRGELVK